MDSYFLRYLVKMKKVVFMLCLFFNIHSELHSTENDCQDFVLVSRSSRDNLSQMLIPSIPIDENINYNQNAGNGYEIMAFADHNDVSTQALPDNQITLTLQTRHRQRFHLIHRTQKLRLLNRSLSFRH